MRLMRILRYGVDPYTRQLLGQMIGHPMTSFYQALLLLNKNVDFEERMLLKNLALGLPDRVASTYKAELEHLSSIPCDEVTMFPYPLCRTSRLGELETGVDGGMPYVVHNGDRFYFPKNTSVGDLVNTYRYFVEEEGILGTGLREKSPHSYVSDSFKVEEGDVVVDIGCSDGLFALDNVHLASREYLFESWSRWFPALKATFAPFVDKVTLVNKMVTDKTAGNQVRLIDAIPNDPKNTYFIKMDIEGGERSVLAASKDFLKANKVKLSCCVYHRQDDDVFISSFLRELGYQVAYSDGYVLPLINGIRFPYFRRGVIHARNY